jgi:hypothetical protein
MSKNIHLEYFSNPASLFAIAARQRKPRVIEFRCGVDCRVGAYHARPGENLTATETDKGLWAITNRYGEEFAALNGRDLNKLAGRVLVEVQP